jgi:hypothetical protein
VKRLGVTCVLVFGLTACTSGESDPPGGPCLDHGECESNICLPGAEGGYCAQACADEDECVPASCGLVVVSRDSGDSLAAVCVESTPGAGLLGHVCASDADCFTGICHDDECAELCTDCGPGASCEVVVIERAGHSAELAACQWDAARADLELGPVAVDTSGSPEISFEIPAGLASFTIVLVHDFSDYTQRVGFISLVGPDDTLLFDYDDEVQDLNQGSIRYPGASAVLVPSTDDPAARPQPGTYRLRVGIYETDFQTFTPVAGEIDRVAVIFESLGASGGVLDVNLFFAPATGLSAAEAPASSYVATILATVASHWEAGTVNLGQVSYADLSATYNEVDTSDQVREICDLYSAPGPHRAAANLFIVDSIAFAAGYTGGTPAPPGLFATPATGVVVEMMGNARDTGTVLAHELGHFLGLKHTTRLNQTEDGWEVAGDDGVLDTPSCSGGSAVEDCPDYRNLMFPLFPLSADLSLSASQRAIVAGNPTLYELDVGRSCAATSSTYDITGSGFAGSDSAALIDDVDGSCGGTGAADRMHLYRVAESGRSALEITVRGFDFAPVIHVRYADCSASLAELACESGDADSAITATIADPEVGYYFIAVDGRDGVGGQFALQVVEVTD